VNGSPIVQQQLYHLPLWPIVAKYLHFAACRNGYKFMCRLLCNSSCASYRRGRSHFSICSLRHVAKYVDVRVPNVQQQLCHRPRLRIVFQHLQFAARRQGCKCMGRLSYNSSCVCLAGWGCWSRNTCCTKSRACVRKISCALLATNFWAFESMANNCAAFD